MDKKTIWHKNYSLAELNKRGQNTMVSHIDIKIVEIGTDYLIASMPVDHRTKQPIGILHGGASVALAESVGSLAGNMVVDSEKYCVGLEISANHLKKVSSGDVIAKASPLHLGQSTQVWEIKITQEQKLCCISRLTLLVLSKSKSV